MTTRTSAWPVPLLRFPGVMKRDDSQGLSSFLDQRSSSFRVTMPTGKDPSMATKHCGRESSFARSIKAFRIKPKSIDRSWYHSRYAQYAIIGASSGLICNDIISIIYMCNTVHHPNHPVKSNLAGAVQ